MPMTQEERDAVVEMRWIEWRREVDESKALTKELIDAVNRVRIAVEDVETAIDRRAP